jgi:hypothetical protein
MLAAKIGNADGIFIPRPFDAAHGLMEPDGTPGPLLLPWRTAAEMLAGTRYLGKIVLPNRSSNYVFERDGEAMMVVWNSFPVEERLYLGDDVYQIDLWGNKTAAEFETDRDDFKKQSIQVGALPIFLTGVDATIAQWRMSLEIETKELESIFGQRQRVSYHFKNQYPSISGSVVAVVPPAWVIDTPKSQFELFANELRQQDLQVLLGTNASIGLQ